MSPLIRLSSEVIKAGYNFLCIFDASTLYQFDKEKGINDRAAYRQLIQLYPNLFAMAPGGIRADDFILPLADKQGSSVVSNDRFRDYEKRYAWLVNDTNRLVKGRLMGGMLVIPNLGITASVGNNLTEELDELKSMLPAPKLYPQARAFRTHRNQYSKQVRTHLSYRN